MTRSKGTSFHGLIGVPIKVDEMTKPKSFLERSKILQLMSDLAGLLSKMTSSRDAFIQLINQLLHEIRASRQSSQSSTSIPSSSPTLSNLLADQPRGKRKRSITHFDGIPILAITPPTPRSDWRGRKVVYQKKVMALDWQMDKLRVVGSGSTIGTSESAYEADDESDEDDDMMIVI